MLAGDIHIKDKGTRWILDQKSQVPVIYVMGNHEFYGDKFPGLIDKLKEATKGSTVHILESDTFELDGYTFFGCTLWTDMALFGNKQDATIAVRDAMNDYQVIRLSKTYRRLTPGDTITYHSATLTQLKKFLEKSDPDRTIVVTHHAPSFQSVPQKYRSDIISAGFSSNLDDLIKRYQPRLWIHGHTHNSFCYKIGKTTVICNPRGYVTNSGMQENSEFKPDYCFTV
ncbi:MAG: metallophosphoesterase [bacterium]